MLTICPHAGGDMTNQLTAINHQPFDYQYLKGLLKDYHYPRNKISKMLKSGEIIALKSGLYVLSSLYNQPLVREVVANLLYGPSYVSLEYALAHYNLIPEAVFNVTSVTCGRKKIFRTQIGTFVYNHLKTEYYNIGYVVDRIEDVNYLIAIPEKALCDKLYFSPLLRDVDALEKLLYEDLRLDTSFIKKMDHKVISVLAGVGRSTNLSLLHKLVVNSEH